MSCVDVKYTNLFVSLIFTVRSKNSKSATRLYNKSSVDSAQSFVPFFAVGSQVSDKIG